MLPPIVSYWEGASNGTSSVNSSGDSWEILIDTMIQYANVYVDLQLIEKQ